MKQAIYAFIIVALLSGIAFYKNSSATECLNVEGQIVIWNGWPPWVRIESKDNRSVFGIETDDEITKSDFMPEALLKELQSKHFLTGTFCIRLTGEQTTLPCDERVIKYIKVIKYEIRHNKE